ncbi:MAG: DUF2752 domain-containing protein [Prevotella sp.]|nr:DUF2752 domain-containing protein [Prevotella sp.]MDY4218753.1 DUF2752 domain-containing protein [Prevotella sp.]
MKKRLLVVFSLTTIIVVGLYVFNPTVYWFMPKCSFKMLTGLNCPACGIQRFIHTLLHGEPLRAIKYNYFMVYSIPYAVLLLVGWLLPRSVWKTKIERITHHRIAVGIYIAAFLVWFILRNILKI